jgi:hypothetical protein
MLITIDVDVLSKYPSIAAELKPPPDAQVVSQTMQ